MSRPDPLTRLIEQLQRLPGIGAKSAQRLAFHILRADDADALGDLVEAVGGLEQHLLPHVDDPELTIEPLFAEDLIVVVLPDTGERYLSTILFEGIFDAAGAATAPA